LMDGWRRLGLASGPRLRIRAGLLCYLAYAKHEGMC
jgi:hypothetical protein